MKIKKKRELYLTPKPTLQAPATAGPAQLTRPCWGPCWLHKEPTQVVPGLCGAESNVSPP